MGIDTVSMDGQIYRHLTGILSLVLRPINTSSARGQMIFFLPGGSAVLKAGRKPACRL